MLCLLSARRLKPGSWDQFRRAWDAEGTRPPGFMRAYHLRNIRDEDEVISLGVFDTSLEDFRAWRGEHEDEELKRQDAMASFVESISTEGIYEVIEELTEE